MKRLRNILGVMLVAFAVLALNGSVTDLQANYLKKAYKSVKKKAKKIIHKGKKYVKKGKNILHKGKIIGKSIGRGYVLIGKRLYKTTKSASKSIFKIGKTFYTLEAKGLIFIGKSIIYDGILIGENIGNGLVKVDGVVYEIAKGVKASAAAASDLVLGSKVYRRRGSHRRVVSRSLPDLVISNISLDKNCRVVVRVRNVGKGKIPINVWTQHKPSSSSVYLKVNGKNWGGATIWKFDRSKRLLRAGGSAVFKSSLKVKGSQNITAIVDMTRQVKESNERNNAKTKKLTCSSKVSFKPIGKKPIMKRSLPDLVVKDIRVAKGCGIKVTIANIGKGGVPVSGYGMSNGASIQMYNNNKPWGGIRLGAIDKAKKLSRGKGMISFIWFPGTKNLKLNSGKNRIKLVIDNNNAVKESNERNNAKTKTLTCMKPLVNNGVIEKLHPAMSKPDLIVKSLSLNSRCNIVIVTANIGKGGVPNSAYNVPNKTFLVLYDGTQLLGGISLADLDSAKHFKSSGASITSTWNPGNFNKTMPTHTIKAIIDYGKIVKESRENNNYRIAKLKCKNRRLKEIGKKGVNIPKQSGSSSHIGIKTNIPKKMRKVMPNEKVEVPKQMPQGALH